MKLAPTSVGCSKNDQWLMELSGVLTTSCQRAFQASYMGYTVRWEGYSGGSVGHSGIFG